MTKRLLVDVATGRALVSETTYVTVQNNEKGLIKTIGIEAGHPKFQAEKILEIAQKYKINEIKIDTQGFGIAVFDFLVDIVGEGNNNRKTGEIHLGSKDAWQQLLDKIYKIDTSEVKLNHITDEMVKFRKYVEDKLKAIDEKEEVDSRTTQLELQSRLLEEQQKLSEVQNSIIKLQLQLFENKRKDNVNVNIDTNKWITGSSTGDTIKEILNKEFDTAKDIITSGTVDFIKCTPIGLDKTINVNFPSKIKQKENK